MSILGREVTVTKVRDPTKAGSKGLVLLETQNTFLLASGRKKIVVEKKGTVLTLYDSDGRATCVDIEGRLEDRLRSKKR